MHNAPRLLLWLLALSLAFSVPASAQSMAELHEIKRIKNKLCMIDHTHTGASQNHRTKRKALRAAIRDWQSFTAWEYGKAWGNYRRAMNRQEQCFKLDRTWSCNVGANPCRRARRR